MAAWNRYAGACVSESGPGSSGRDVATVPQAEGSSLTAQAFFKDFVALRKPLLVRGHLSDEAWTLSARWSLAWFEARAGPERVKVEVRDPEAGSGRSFGQGREVEMPVAALCKHVREGGEALYMTTQDLTHDADGRPALFGTPVTCLSDCFPVRPRLAGNLIPANLNIWLGRSAAGSSSGLHHDFHDNLYLLLRGRKRFRLFAPSDAGRLPMVGTITAVHPNGRFQYEGETVNADGSDAGASAAQAAADAQAAASRELEEAEAAVERGEPGAGARLERAEAALDAAMEAVLDAEAGGEGAASDEDEDEDEDEDGFPAGGDEEDDEAEAMDAAEMERLWKKTARSAEARKAAAAAAAAAPAASSSSSSSPPAAAAAAASSSPLPEGVSSSSAGAAAVGSARPAWRVGDALPPAKDPPKNFCTVTSDQARAIPGTSMLEVEVHAGDMLYMPAGWYHEVVSLDAVQSPEAPASASAEAKAAAAMSGAATRAQLAAAAAEGKEADLPYHCAMNYWFHPPDADEFEAPYTSGFWARDWEERDLDA